MPVDKDKDLAASSLAAPHTSSTARSTASSDASFTTASTSNSTPKPQNSRMPKRTSEGIEIVDISDDGDDMDNHFTLDDIMDDEDAELLRYAEMHPDEFGDDFDDLPFDGHLPAEPDYIHDGRLPDDFIPNLDPQDHHGDDFAHTHGLSNSDPTDASRPQNGNGHSVGDHLFLDLEGGLWQEADEPRINRTSSPAINSHNPAMDAASEPYDANASQSPMDASAQSLHSRMGNGSPWHQGRQSSAYGYSEPNNSFGGTKSINLGEVRLSALKNIRNLRAWFKDASASDINDILILFGKLKAEKEQEQLEARRKEEAHRAFVRMYRDNGTAEPSISFIDPQALIDGLVDRLACGNYQYNKTKVKYRFIDLNGKICEWTGQGREPKRLKDIMEATGKPREAFLYQPEMQGYNEVDPDEIQYISQLVAHETQAKKYEDYVNAHAPWVNDIDKRHITFSPSTKRSASKRKAKSDLDQPDVEQ